MLGNYTSWAWSASSCFMAAWAAGIFLFAKEYAVRPMGNKFLLNISALSFAIYIVHPIFTNGLYKALHWASMPMPPVVFEVVTFLIVFGCSFVLAAALRKLPWLGRYL